MSIDADFNLRLNCLADLMIVDPDKFVRRLQWEALKYYPLSSKEGIRGWMTVRIAFLASDLLTKREENETSSNNHNSNSYVPIWCK